MVRSLLAIMICMGIAASAIAASPPSRLPCVAVLLMGSDAESLAAEEALYQMGIPHYVTRSLKLSQQAAMMLVSFGQVERVTEAFSSSLSSYVKAGGILVAQKPRDERLSAIFGYRSAIASKGRHEIVWESIDSPLKRYVDSPEENVIRLGSYSNDELFWTVGYLSEAAQIVARFEDGTAAITERALGRGKAIAIGASLIDLVIRSYLDRDFGVHKVGSNSFEPSTDMTLLLIKAIYQHYIPHGLTIATMPPGKRGALIITHDIDAISSFNNIEDFAKTESRYGVRGTIFLQTKYLKDYYDTDFMTLENLRKMRKLARQGFEIGSHSVSHTPHFARLPLGQIVKDPDFYRPRIVDMTETVNATVRGELWVSKSVICANGMPPPRSFRTGHLLFNKYLVNVLEEANYRYDSSMGVYHCGCNFPFRQFKMRSFHAPSRIIEIPVTISDYDWLEDMTQLLPNFKQIIIKNAANGAPVTLLVHPTRKSDKLETVDLLLRWLPDDFWVGTLEEFGRFWRTRYSLNPQIEFTTDSIAYRFRPVIDTEPVAVEPNSPCDSIVVPDGTIIDEPGIITLPSLDRRSTFTIKILTDRSSKLPESGVPTSQGDDPVEHRISLRSGLESYKDYDRTGLVPIMRGSLWIRKYLPGAWGIKLWDYFSWRPGEAAEATNEVGLTYNRSLTTSITTWLRLVNRSYLRKFPHSSLKFNEPRMEVTFKHRTNRVSYLVDGSLRTAFYSSPDSIAEKTYLDLRLKPSVVIRLAEKLSLQIWVGLDRRSYRRENLGDIYSTNFYGCSTGFDLRAAKGRSRFSADLGWMLRRYTETKDRGSISARIGFGRNISKAIALESRIAYMKAEFTEPEYDRFFWGEALTSYSANLDFLFSRSENLSLRLGASYRLEDYKQSHFKMHYLAVTFGISTRLANPL